MKAQMRSRPGGYEFIWGEEAIAIRLERMREKSDTISAEISVYETPINEDTPLLMGVRSNLMSDAAPGKLAKRLAARKNNVNWPDLVEAAFASTIREYRKSNPVVHIGQLPARTKPKWRLEPFILEGNICMIFGDGGIGKSTMARLFGLCIQQGWGEELGLCATQGTVLFLDYESNQEDSDDSCKALAAGLNLPQLPDLIYRRGKPPILGEMEEIEAIVKQHNIKGIIIDSIVRACGGEKEAKENSAPTIDALASLGISALLISHIPKESFGPRQKTPYGSIYFWNGPRLIWEMRKEEEEGESIIDVAFFDRKHNLTEQHRPIGFRIEFDEFLGIKISRKDVSKMPVLGKGISLRQRILKLLGRGPLTIKEIAEELEEDYNSVKTTLARGKHSGLWIQLSAKPSTWGLGTEMPLEREGDNT